MEEVKVEPGNEVEDIEYGSGLLVERADSRDALFAAFEDVAGAFPDSFALDRLPFVRNQLLQFSCVCQTVARIQDYANRLEGDNRKTAARYGYAYCKLWDGQPTLQGTFTRTGFDVAVKLGFADAIKWEDNSSLSFAEYIARPTVDADSSAQPFRFSGYVQMSSPNEIKTYLMKYKLPVSLGLNANNTAWGGTVVRANNYVIQEPTGSRLGHLMALVGWEPRGWIIENSWGESWGDKGRAIVPYNHSGLHAYFFGGYDLPNNWKSINEDYKNMIGYDQVNDLQHVFAEEFLGRKFKPEELGIVKQRNLNILANLKEGGVAGHNKNRKEFRGFVPENIEAAKSGRIPSQDIV